MNVIPYSKTIFIFKGDSDHSHPTKYLLENHDRVVRVFERCEDFFAENPCKDTDIVLLNFERHHTASFSTLNRLMFCPDRPEIVITSDETSVFRPGDQFLGGRITILFHPYTPGELLRTIDQVGLR